METFFRGRFSIVAKLPEVQSAVEGGFPNLFIPQTKEGEALALRPYQFMNPEGSRSLAIALNQATFIAFDYPGFATFLEEATAILPLVLEKAGVDELARVVYRYDNAIEIGRDGDGCLSLGDILDLSLPEWCGGDGLFEAELRLQQRWSHGRVGCELFVEGDGPTQMLRVVISAVVEPAGAVGDLVPLATQAHQEAYRRFDCMITPGFRKLISLGRWEEVEDE